jgi:hypothetical protein
VVRMRPRFAHEPVLALRSSSCFFYQHVWNDSAAL